MPQFVRGSDGRIYEIQDSGDGTGVFAIMAVAAMMAAYNAYLWLLSHYIFVGWITLFGFITWVGWVYHEYQQGEAKHALGKKIGSFALILVGFGLAVNGCSSSADLNDTQKTILEESPTKSATSVPAPKKTTTVTAPSQIASPKPVPTPMPATDNAVEKNAALIGYVKTVQGSPLRMRTSPADTAKIVTMITNGGMVTILGYGKEEVVVKGERGKWCNIRYGKDEGWAWGNLISLSK